MNNLKVKVNDLNVDKLKTVPVELIKLSHVVDNEFVKNTKYNTSKTKVNNIETKIPDATQINKTYIKKFEMLIKKYQIQVV